MSRVYLTAAVFGFSRTALSCPACYKSADDSAYLMAALFMLALLVFLIGLGSFLLYRYLHPRRQ